jgi:hypothetical protein
VIDDGWQIDEDRLVIPHWILGPERGLLGKNYLCDDHGQIRSQVEHNVNRRLDFQE